MIASKMDSDPADTCSNSSTYTAELTDTHRRVAYATIAISCLCLAAMATVLPVIHLRLDSAQSDIQRRMDVFSSSSRGLWQDLVAEKRVRRQGGYGSGPAADEQQCHSCVQLNVGGWRGG